MKSKKVLPKVLTLTCVVLAAGLGHVYYQNSQVPELGVTVGRLKPLSKKPNCVSSQAEDPEKRVDPLSFKSTPEDTMAALKTAVVSYGNGEVQKQSDDYLYVVFSSPMMKFRDDAEFWLDSENEVVHFRSAARAGYSDMGMNRKRYRKITDFYNKL